jgi:hypothetical protein
MTLPPSRRDDLAPPAEGRDVTDLRALVRHQGTNLRALDNGFLGGHWATPQLLGPEHSDLTGGADGSDSGSGSDIAFWNTDQAVAGEPGQITLNLTWEPIDGSLHIRWNGVDQPPTEWTLDEQTVTFTSPLIKPGHRLTAAYAYDNGVMADPSDILVPFGSSGWKWVDVPPAADIDYSDPAFDDSAWAVASAPFGDTNPDFTDPFGHGWPIYVTTFAQGTRMWARRVITDADAGFAVTISLRWNRAIHVYWNGAAVYSNSSDAGEATFTVDGSLVLASNTLAIKTVDDGFSGPGTGCYFDAQISQEVD